MVYQERFSDADLAKIIEEGLIYMCACPAQVADTLRHARNLYRYQINCLEGPNNDPFVHSNIAESAVRIQAELEDCLMRILVHEKWDLATLQMPANLRQRQAREISSESQFFDLPGE
jgi:hypothetical protein